MTIDRWCGDLTITLGHDHNAKRLHTSAALPNIGSVVGCHRHVRLLLLQRLHQDISLPTIPSCVIITNALPSPPAMPAKRTPRHRPPRRATRFRTSRNPRRSRRRATGRCNYRVVDTPCIVELQSSSADDPPFVGTADPPFIDR
jgi:hypothetical protein